MSATSSLHGSARSAAGRPSAVRRRSPAAGAGVRWDRIGRLALLVVLVALIYLYGSAGLRMLSTWQQSRHDRAVVAGLEREHGQLERAHETLSGQTAVEAQARRLGMIRPGEQPFAIAGLPND